MGLSVPFEDLKEKLPRKQHWHLRGGSSEMQDPWLGLLTQAQPSVLPRPAVSNRNIMLAPYVILNVPIATF